MSRNIAADFQDIEIIGRGSFGLIWKVKHRPSGRIFVRKEISYKGISKKEEKQLASEFEILQSLHHPNIVQVYDIDKNVDKQIINIYMEYCDGGDVSQLIKKYRESKKYIPETLIWQIFTQTLLALYRCHNGIDIEPVASLFQETSNLKIPEVPNLKQVLHRDIKPENIFFLSDNYTVKLGDFGLAKCLGPNTSFTQTYVGTPYYMPPEVVSEQEYNALCDVWSLGCVMYEMCALKPPFTASTHSQLQEKIKRGVYNPIPSCYSNRLKLCISACLITELSERADVNLLLQNTSFKIYRREWELNQQEFELAKREIELKKREISLIRFKEELITREKQAIMIDKALEDERRLMNLKNDETRKIMRQEFDNVVHAKVEEKIRQFISEFKENQVPLHKLLSKHLTLETKQQQQQQIPQLQPQSQSQSQTHQVLGSNNYGAPSSPIKLRGPRSYEDVEIPRYK
ncbi:unnamed protein product [Pichia kudriavzevii]